jgi:hypothetical protein
MTKPSGRLTNPCAALERNMLAVRNRRPLDVDGRHRPHEMAAAVDDQGRLNPTATFRILGGTGADQGLVIFRLVGGLGGTPVPGEKVIGPS